VTDLVLDRSHDYGNKYSDGILPVGDGKVVLDGPKQGYIYLCNEGGQGGGADVRGPWFVNDNTEYDINQKIHVEGEVNWDGTYSMTVSGDTRSITTNAVPDDHPTGVFPVAPSDPAYQYDRNPNHIEAQNLTYALAANPQLADQPQCMGGEVGVSTSGVALFNGFDAGNRDAGAWEIQDGCDGHPQMTSEYHYHTLSSCIDDVSVDTVLGWALDGFPITGPKLSEENILTTGDLDECHGITSAVEIDGKSVTTYHYVMTQDFPYSVSCFRATPVRPPGAGVG
jgi:YHYH protein